MERVEGRRRQAPMRARRRRQLLEEPGMNGKEVVSRFLAAEAKQDVQRMADVLAEDIVFEMPFALPGLPDRVEGKDTVVEFLEKFLGKQHGMFTGWDIYNIRI